MTGTQVHVGQRVRVPWGLDTVEGTIVELVGRPPHRVVRVAIQLGAPDDADDAVVIALPTDSIDAATAA